MTTLLELFVIYNRPPEAPDHFLVRRWFVGYRGPEPTDDQWRAPTIDEARWLIPPGLCLIPRHPSDEPQIVETWM